MNKLSIQEQTQVIRALVEGNSIRSTVRMTGVAKNTIVKLLAKVGNACQEFHDKNVVNLQKTRRIQSDEIWAFIHSKEKNATYEMKEKGAGDIWTWTALDPDSKLIVSWLVGDHTKQNALLYMQDLASRLVHRIQLTTDGMMRYVDAVDEAFGTGIDYAQLIKIFGSDAASGRYSPPECIGTKKKVIMGNPDLSKASTSNVERQNLTMRMGMRRFTRLTNAFSKKIENHCYAIALHFVYYNFVRVHQTLRVTPAMEAGLTKKPYSIEDILALTEK